MPNVTLTRAECERDRLPGVCMLCGEPATVRRRRTFSSPAFLTTKKMELRAPACGRHAHHWFRQSAVVVTSFFGVAALGIVVGLLLDELGNPPGPWNALFFVGWGVCFLGWVVFAGVYTSAGVRSLEVTDRSLRLTGVHEAFIEALEAGRAVNPRDRDEYGDERDDYDELRPPRRRTSEDDDYLPRRRPLSADEPDDRPRPRDE